MKTTETIHFLRRLALFIRSGMSLPVSFELIAQQIRRPKSRRIVAVLAEDVLRGKKLSDALSRFPRTFHPLYVSLVQVGEASGHLPQHLDQAATLLARRRDDTRRMQGSLAYPCIVGCATIAITLFLTLYAFPKILPLFKGFHRSLPLPTRILIGITDFSLHYGWLVLIGICILICASLYAVRLPRVRDERDRLMLRLPFFGSMLSHFYTVSVTATLATLLESGIGILPSLAMLSSGIQQRAYEDALMRMHERVSSGRPVSQAFSEEPDLFPGLVVQLVQAGELTGTLPESLRNAAQIYEQYLEEQSRLLQSLVEPALILIMGLLVGFVAMAIITPVYSLTQGITIH